MSRGLRPIVEPFVVSAPAGARVRTRLVLSDSDALVLRAVGGHLGTLAAADLDVRCRQRSLDAKAAALSRRERKQALTAGATSRWAGAITRTSNDAWDLAERNLQAAARSLRARVGRIRRRLAAPVGGRSGRVRGYASRQERWEKQRWAQALAGRLAGVEARLAEGRVSVCRGGRGLARARHNLGASDLSENQWRQHWQARRWFITADGEKDKIWGNETIRWHPQERWLEVKLPAPLAHLANRRHGRYRLSCRVGFPYRGEEVAAQAATGAIRYDISYDSGKNRWHLDASWTFSPQDQASLHELRHSPVLAADLNIGHLATWPPGHLGDRPVRQPDRAAADPPPRPGRPARGYPRRSDARRHLRADLDSQGKQLRCDRGREPRLYPGPDGGTGTFRAPPLHRAARARLPVQSGQHPDRTVSGPPGADGR